jgi:hypothetical protein
MRSMEWSLLKTAVQTKRFFAPLRRCGRGWYCAIEHDEIDGIGLGEDSRSDEEVLRPAPLARIGSKNDVVRV